MNQFAANCLKAQTNKSTLLSVSRNSAMNCIFPFVLVVRVIKMSRTIWMTQGFQANSSDSDTCFPSELFTGGCRSEKNMDL